MHLLLVIKALTEEGAHDTFWLRGKIRRCPFVWGASGAHGGPRANTAAGHWDHQTLLPLRSEVGFTQSITRRHISLLLISYHIVQCINQSIIIHDINLVLLSKIIQRVHSVHSMNFIVWTSYPFYLLLLNPPFLNKHISFTCHSVNHCWSTGQLRAG